MDRVGQGEVRAFLRDLLNIVKDATILGIGSGDLPRPSPSDLAYPATVPSC